MNSISLVIIGLFIRRVVVIYTFQGSISSKMSNLHEELLRIFSYCPFNVCKLCSAILCFYLKIVISVLSLYLSILLKFCLSYWSFQIKALVSLTFSIVCLFSVSVISALFSLRLWVYFALHFLGSWSRVRLSICNLSSFLCNHLVL